MAVLTGGNFSMWVNQRQSFNLAQILEVEKPQIQTQQAGQCGYNAGRLEERIGDNAVGMVGLTASLKSLEFIN